MTYPIRVFEPPEREPAGANHGGEDSERARFAVDLEWLGRRGVDVERVSLTEEPGLWDSHTVVTAELAEHGDDCLPLILVADVVVARGRYPSRTELVRHAELDAQLANATPGALVGPDTRTEALARLDDSTDALARLDDSTEALARLDDCTEALARRDDSTDALVRLDDSTDALTRS